MQFMSQVIKMTQSGLLFVVLNEAWGTHWFSECTSWGLERPRVTPSLGKLGGSSSNTAQC